MGKYIVNYGEKTIVFILQRKNVKNINLNIRPNMDVVVSANHEVPIDYILGFVKRKADWILKRIDYFKCVQSEVSTNKEIVSGETYKYLGKQYRLRVVESKDEMVKYERGFIYIFVKDKSNYKRKEALINMWFKERASIVFDEILNKLYATFKKYNVSKPKLEVRKMKVRWGSCIINSNKILLNVDLIKAPKYCIEYVILHELIHLIYEKHNNQFYDLLTVLMPDWQTRKKILDEEVVRFL